MAKDLPYFKFFCSEWNDGDITLESYENQGLFINICSYYWSNECDVSLGKLLKKFKGFDKIINELIEENLIKVDDDNNIIISFLDEQRQERLELSKEKRKAGKASAEARRLKKIEQVSNKDLTENEHVLNLCSTESQLLRREEIREEEKKEKKIIKEDTPTAFNFRNSFLELGVDNQILNDWLDVRKKKRSVNSETAFKLFISEVQKSKLTISQAVEMCAGRSWASYKVEYDKENEINNQPKERPKAKCDWN